MAGGIASDRSPGIQIGPITSIGTEVAPTPAIGDLMEAFKQGFITVDDLKRRAQQERLSNDAEKTQLQAGDFQRRLAPGAFENAQAAQGLQAAQIQAAQQILPGALTNTLGEQDIVASTQTATAEEQRRQANRLSDDTSRQLAQKADDTKRLYVETFGHDPAKSINLDAPLPAVPFQGAEGWFAKEHGKEVLKQIDSFDPGVPEIKDREQIILDRVNQFVSDFPLGSKKDNVARADFERTERARINSLPNPDALRAQYAAQVEAEWKNRPEIRTEYENYKTAQAKNQEPVKSGSEAHTTILQQRIQDAQDKAALRAANIKAVPDLIVARGKAAAEALAKAAEAQNKAQGDVLMELHKSESLKRFEPQFEAFEKVDAIRNAGRAPTNADDIAVLYEFVKLLDPTSAVREGEAKLAQSTVPGVKQIYNKALGLFTDHNKIMDPQARTSMFNTMDTLKAGAIRTIAPEIKRVSNIAIDRGVPLDQVFTGPYRAILSGGGTPATSAATVPSGPPWNGQSVIRDNKTGQSWRFNPADPANPTPL